jgi:glycosyltransferase involved in cell wall biosynthesis
MVTVHVLTYMHEKYIYDCLFSIVNQSTNFAFEVVVVDDGSTDKTQWIIREFEHNFPHIIKAKLLSTNTFSQFGFTPIRGIFFENTMGKYVAICEGDDLWTDQFKLKKQVDFLESHPEVVVSTHAFNRRNEFKNKSYVVTGKNVSEISSSSFFVNNWNFTTSSIVFRSIHLKDFLDHNYFSGDKYLFFKLCQNGLVHYSEDNMCLYRDHPTGITKVTKIVQILLSDIEMFECLKSESSDTEFHRQVNTYIENCTEKLSFLQLSTFNKLMFIFQNIKKKEFHFKWHFYFTFKHK